MIFFPLLVGEVLKNGMPDHISLSSFHDSFTWYHGGKRKLNMRQGFLYSKGFEKMECLTIFLSISLSCFHDFCTRDHGEKRKLNKRQDFLYCKGFEKMECLPYFSLFFP
jgi:hypothetical protein